MRRELTPEVFLKDVAEHEMTVLLDQGLYRHLMFQAKKNSWNHWFEIVTYPNKLVLSGDMGTWVFSRVEDMLTFFRSDEMRINLSYWSEKLQNGTSGGRDDAKEYDGDYYKQNILDHLDGYDLEPEKKSKVIEELNSLDFHDQYEIISQIRDFEVDLEDDGDYDYRSPRKKRETFSFQDVWEIGMKTYSLRFVWCCYAIVWGIQQWDKRDQPPISSS